MTSQLGCGTPVAGGVLDGRGVMRRTPVWTAALALLCAIVATTACSPAEEPPVEVPENTADVITDTGAAGLWETITAEDYLTWERAPGYEEPVEAVGPHGDQVEIYVNEPIELTLATGETEVWPEGSIIVKDALVDGRVDQVAAMWKREGVWLYAEYEPDGVVIAEGEEDPRCTGCHSTGSDFVNAFELP